MDRLGYSYDMIKYRQHTFEEIGTIEHIVYTGGKGEGTALFHENDIDGMIEMEGIICADDPQQYIQRENIMLFHTERRETAPGYTRLNLLKMDGPVTKEIAASLFEAENGSFYLSSQFFTDEVNRNNRGAQADLNVAATSGPSIPTTVGSYCRDNVWCIKCFCPDILEGWVSRQRYNGWPSQNIIHEVSLLDGHVAPVGFKGSQNMYREWRICYSLAELRLIKSFNGTQLKLYILLKKLSKSLLNPVCEDMTSYIMKNIVLWLCESNGLDKFTPSLFIDRLLDCINFLRVCVIEYNLPSYMIPERNLLAGRLTIPQRQQLISLLGDLLCEEGRMLLRCDKLREGMVVMYKCPSMFKEFSEKRDKVESLELILCKMIADIAPELSPEECQWLLSQNEQALDIVAHVDYLIQFDRQTLTQVGKTDDEIMHLRHT